MTFWGGGHETAQPLAKGGSRFNGRRGEERIVHECADSRSQKERLVVRDTPEREENKGVKGTARKAKRHVVLFNVFGGVLQVRDPEAKRQTLEPNHIIIRVHCL